MKYFGIIGNPIEHSLSPVMHTSAFQYLGIEAVFHRYLVKQGDLAQAVEGAKALGFSGLNVTIPFKEEVFNLMESDKLAQQIGAANVIDFNNGRAYNTDGPGAALALKEEGVSLKDCSILILGAGGGAKALSFQLGEEGAELVIFNRTPSRALELKDRLQKASIKAGIVPSASGLKNAVINADVVVNATSVGMHPEVDRTPIDGSYLHKDQVVFDAIYNPLRTRLLREAEAAGAKTIDGVKMLVYQGAMALNIWVGIEIDSGLIEVMEKTVRGALE